MFVDVFTTPAYRLLEEVTEVNNNMLNLDLPVTEACLKEGMRIKPVGPVVIRRALEPDTQLGLASGDNVVISLEKMHNTESRFPSPSHFNPGNFLKLDGKTPRSSDELEFLPFGTGPKSCVGQHLAMREMKAIMVKLVRKWSITLLNRGRDSIQSMKVRWDIAQQPVDQILVQIERRLTH